MQFRIKDLVVRIYILSDEGILKPKSLSDLYKTMYLCGIKGYGMKRGSST